ncbi:hypothetical protein [Conchiformibius steedae]|uniref:DUF6915 family protein n=1 Tax=Conchiformibius steedae TaxID=153493 RepID=UPI0026F31768|nr:hypothetical protein [Conchiformibius steedae]
MTPLKHALLSQKRRGGEWQDYIAIHSFIDSTKMLCSDNRHRILHTHWGIQEVVIPIFGEALTNSAGKMIAVKELCEHDHLLPDFHNRFIPTLADFTATLSDLPDTGLAQRIDRFHRDHVQDHAVSATLLSPLSVTGQLKSLLFTHNSWFINTILPMMYPVKPRIAAFDISPDLFFNQMRFEMWMDNGAVYPPSAQKLHF